MKNDLSKLTEEVSALKKAIENKRMPELNTGFAGLGTLIIFIFLGSLANSGTKSESCVEQFKAIQETRTMIETLNLDIKLDNFAIKKNIEKCIKKSDMPTLK